MRFRGSYRSSAISNSTYVDVIPQLVDAKTAGFTQRSIRRGRNGTTFQRQSKPAEHSSPFGTGTQDPRAFIPEDDGLCSRRLFSGGTHVSICPATIASPKRFTAVKMCIVEPQQTCWAFRWTRSRRSAQQCEGRQFRHRLRTDSVWTGQQSVSAPRKPPTSSRDTSNDTRGSTLHRKLPEYGARYRHHADAVWRLRQHPRSIQRTDCGAAWPTHRDQLPNSGHCEPTSSNSR